MKGLRIKKNLKIDNNLHVLTYQENEHHLYSALKYDPNVCENRFEFAENYKKNKQLINLVPVD